MFESKKKLVKAFILGISLLSANSVFAVNELKNITLAVGVYPVGAPFAFLDRDIEHPKGMDVDIIFELQRRLGFTLAENRVYPIDFQHGLERVKNGALDLFAGGVSFSEERAKTYDFSPIYYEASLGIVYSPKHMTISNPKPEDFKGKKIGFLPGTIAADYIEKFEMVGDPVTNLTLAYFHVDNGIIDGILYDRPPLASFARQVSSIKLAVTTERFGEEAGRMALMMPKDSPHSKLIMKTVQQMIDDGTMQQILDKWQAE